MTKSSRPKNRPLTDWLEFSTKNSCSTNSSTWPNRFYHNTRIFLRARLPRSSVHSSIKLWNSLAETETNHWLNYRDISLTGVRRRADLFWEWRLKTNSLSFCSSSKSIKILCKSLTSCSMSSRRRMISSLLLNHSLSSQKYTMLWRTCQNQRQPSQQSRPLQIASMLCQCSRPRLIEWAVWSLLMRRTTQLHIHTSMRHLKDTDQWMNSNMPLKLSNSCFSQKSWTNSLMTLSAWSIQVFPSSSRIEKLRPWRQ